MDLTRFGNKLFNCPFHFISLFECLQFNLDSILSFEIFLAILYCKDVVNDGSRYIILCSCIYARRGCVIGG